MFPTYNQLRVWLQHVVDDKAAQGHVVTGLAAELARLPDSYDALAAFAERLAHLPLVADWPYVEPDDLPGILAECDPARPPDAPSALDPQEAAARMETAFLGAVCGCILGKPLEFNADLATIRAGLEALGDWPLSDYITERAVSQFGREMPYWNRTYRERIRYVMPDDDINYMVLGMLLLEEHGADLRTAHVRDAWLRNLPVASTFGPERRTLVKAGIDFLGDGDGDIARWPVVLNPRAEMCGAQIRAHAYGYACPGRPGLAAQLAWQDATFTHRRTGVYATMFTAAAIAAAATASEPLQAVETALRFVPQRSRFHAATTACLYDVREATDFLDGYERIHRRFGEYTHCRIYQEVGTVINSLRFAESVGDGICKQVMQGNDTDSYGAITGSILGAYFGPDGLEPRWTARFNDDIRTTLAWFHERSLAAVAQRMGRLAARLTSGV